MTKHTLHLFPDTNLFEQCRALSELEWKEFGDFDEIRLMVCRSVQQEIDDHKNQGNTRISDRARKASSLFRKILLGAGDCTVVRDADPRVSVFLATEYEPSPSLADRLNYDHADDRLVGTTRAFADLHPGADARVLTDDTGPMISAKRTGVPFIPTPEDWRLPPEISASDKELNRLKSELAAMKKSEPEFTLACVDANGQPLEKLEAEQVFYEPLTEKEIADLMGLIREQFPVATDFGSTQPAERRSKLLSAAIFGGQEKFTPATADEIAEYRDVKHPKWLEACETFLQRYHHITQLESLVPSFCFVASNIGTRPAKDALVIIEARGNFNIRPFPWREENDDGEEVQSRRRSQELPSPPTPPRGKWKAIANAYDMMGVYTRALGPMGSAMPVMPHMPIFAEQMKKRDPNQFFWKPDRPAYPVKEFKFECEQWRHAIAQEEFRGQLDCSPEVESISGALACQIHADNLSTVTNLVFPVRITVRHMSAHDMAKELVKRFTKGPFFDRLTLRSGKTI